MSTSEKRARNDQHAIFSSKSCTTGSPYCFNGYSPLFLEKIELNHVKSLNKFKSITYSNYHMNILSIKIENISVHFEYE